MFDELIRRLEAASGPDRELDAHIACVIAGGKLLAFEDRGLSVYFEHTCEHTPFVNHYTSSLDAALTLVPEGWVTLKFEKRLGVWKFSGFDDHGLGACGIGFNKPAAAMAAILKERQYAALKAKSLNSGKEE